MGSWESWFEQLGPALVLFARQWTSSHAAAEDAVQEAFLACFGQEREVDDPRAYLFAAVRNAARQERRGEGRREQREQAIGAATPEPALLECPLELEERGREVERAMDDLPAEQREVVVMKIWGELTFGQIAAATNVSSNTAASRYRYALGALRRALVEEELG